MPEPVALPGWLVVDHIIPGCTPEMIEWWWVNMEKGYELWCPDEHKGFRWLVPPPLGHHIGAVQIATESIDYGPVLDRRIEWVDPNIGTEEIKKWLVYKYVLTACGSKDPDEPAKITLSHQWEAIPGGCKMRSTVHTAPGRKPDPPNAQTKPAQHPSGKKPTGGGWIDHNVAEVGTFKAFLPALWGIWQAVPDPTINRKSSFILKRDGSKLVYV